MPDQRDTVLIEQAKIQRMRLGSALVYGHIGERRTVNDHGKRLMGSIVVAAIACAACVGVSFVSQLLTERAEQANSTVQTPTGAVTP
ncbi:MULTISPECIES: hypothetical protein [Microbacterium]|jgi:hypothetical protein|uniref:Uncharacterized protein n=1 Tax=Microbacterium mcarthurae TaxID=3035918 RepID=A0ABW9GF74_9MICO|nr:hypothetical protein [Microbacterium sp. ACRRU]MCG7416841.1 hypothetical protein [Microbacterium sp. ACRRU]